MLVADLKAMANGLGIAGADSMKKPQLVAAIRGLQDQHAATKRAAPAQEQEKPAQEQPKQEQDPPKQDRQDPPKQDRRKQSQPKQGQSKQDQPKQGQSKQDQPKQGQPKQGQPKQAQQEPDQQSQDDADGDGSRRNRRRRGRDRARSGSLRNEPDTQILEDDVLVPAAGILDVLDNYAFVRTSGYLAGADDVYLSLSMVRKYGLRRGDAVAGQVRQPREGERREKFNPMVRIDSVNGSEPDAARDRVEFAAMTPLHPSTRLRLETGRDDLVGRAVDLLAPVGKGQRGLIVAPARSGRTRVLQAVADSISANNPECHLMVVLVDERPEEVTEYQRSVKGEVISSTFDRPAGDHTAVAELAVERARRLVELGHDVVVLMDGITRLGRAYNMTAPANGRTLAGGVDANALYPPKRFFGAARNLENGGAVTLLAPAPADSRDPGDEQVVEAVRDTANMELWLRRDAADLGLFPAVDVARSGTRHDDELLSRDELQVVRELRRAAAAGRPTERLEELLTELRGTRDNAELVSRKRTAGA